jgi:hypothetical protein
MRSSNKPFVTSPKPLFPNNLNARFSQTFFRASFFATQAQPFAEKGCGSNDLSLNIMECADDFENDNGSPKSKSLGASIFRA